MPPHDLANGAFQRRGVHRAGQAKRLSDVVAGTIRSQVIEHPHLFLRERQRNLMGLAGTLP